MTEKRISNDERVPIEVWERIFDGLYPSQLSRLSLVSKTFYSIVTSLPVWGRLFTRAYPDKELRVLGGRSASGCCMLFMCAISLHFCEECETLIPFQQHNLAMLPLLVLVTLPSKHAVRTTLTNGRADSQSLVGRRINFNWRIRKCLGCRDETSSAVALESVPPWVPFVERGDMEFPYSEWKKSYPQLYLVKVRGSLRTDSVSKESTVVNYLNLHLGGPVAVQVLKDLGSSTKSYDAKTWARIMWYQTQD